MRYQSRTAAKTGAKPEGAGQFDSEHYPLIENF
jgi:hypothetical protein